MRERLGEILDEHRLRYPLMEDADVYKLVYQHELGCAHILDDPGARERLESECMSLMPALGEVAEDIGNGRVRLMLRQAMAAGISVQTLFMMVKNSAARTGSMEALRDELSKIGGMEAYLPPSGDCLPVSHSDAYREAYAPAYRVADKVYADYFDLFCRLDTLLAVKGTAVVAIDGMSCAGKTTLAELIRGLYPARVLHTDDYFLPEHKRTQSRLSQQGGNVDYERLKSEVVEHISNEIRCRRYDCETGRMRRADFVSAASVTVVEGAYAVHPYFGEYYDVAVLLTVDADEQMRRIIMRNGEALAARFEAEWIPMENDYLDGLDKPALFDFTYKPKLY